jgi:predicted nucleotidyltransferase
MTLDELRATGFLADLEDELGRSVNVAEECALHKLIRNQVLKESVPL